VGDVPAPWPLFAYDDNGPATPCGDLAEARQNEADARHNEAEARHNEAEARHNEAEARHKEVEARFAAVEKELDATKGACSQLVAELEHRVVELERQVGLAKPKPACTPRGCSEYTHAQLEKSVRPIIGVDDETWKKVLTMLAETIRMQSRDGRKYLTLSEATLPDVTRREVSMKQVTFVEVITYLCSETETAVSDQWNGIINITAKAAKKAAFKRQQQEAPKPQVLLVTDAKRAERKAERKRKAARVEDSGNNFKTLLPAPEAETPVVAVAETPAVAEMPAVVEIPAVAETPVVADTSAVGETEVVEAAPAVEVVTSKEHAEMSDVDKARKRAKNKAKGKKLKAIRLAEQAATNEEQAATNEEQAATNKRQKYE